MKIEDILDYWNTDSNIDRTEIGGAALDIPKLHHKYYKILINERMILKKYETDFKKLKLDKYEFFTQGPSEETKSKGWKLPPKGMILKTDIPVYIDADQDIIDINLKIALQQEKVNLLEDIIKSINNRNFILRVALDWQKFINGG